MRTKWFGPTAALLYSLIQATGAAAQGASADEPAAKAAIQRQLRQSTVRDESDGLRLRYVVDVFGQAPRIELFGGRENALTGPAPYGAPTHQDMLQIMTPQEFSAPAANFGNLFRWLSDKAKKDK